MKKFLIFTTLGFSAWAFSACGGNENEDTSSITDEVSPQQTEETEETSNYAEKSAALALRASIRTNPGEGDDAKWIETLPFGAQVTLLGDTATVGKKFYIKVKASTGSEGWIRDRWVVINGKVGVAISEISTYKSPDVMSLNKDFTIPFGTIFIVKERLDNEKYNEFVIEGLKQEGYFKKGNEVSFKDLDVEVAILRNAALAEKDEVKKASAVQAILDNIDYMTSPLYKDLEPKEIEVPEFNEEEELFDELEEF